MKVVVDTNIIFSALLKEDKRYARALCFDKKRRRA
jgi:predicted nucleic acid-binding protein